MTETKTVILVAWDNETEHSLSDSDKQRLADHNIELVYTGIGKINATRAITDLVVRNQCKRLYAYDEYHELKPLHIVNVGCAGSHTHGARTLIKPNTFIQRDMDARQFGYEQYHTPEGKLYFRNNPEGRDCRPIGYVTSGEFVTKLDWVNPVNVWCATGDNANGYAEVSEMVPSFDAVDMEAYAFAHVCAHYGVKFTCYKWITDLAAEDSTIEELIENNKLLPWTQIIDEIIALMN